MFEYLHFSFFRSRGCLPFTFSVCFSHVLCWASRYVTLGGAGMAPGRLVVTPSCLCGVFIPAGTTPASYVPPIIAMVPPRRENWSDNLGYGGKISYLCFWLCPGLPARARGSGQWSMVNDQGSMVRERGLPHGKSALRRTRVLSHVSIPKNPKFMLQIQ